METIEVPKIFELPDLPPRHEDPLAFADLVLTKLMHSEVAFLHAEYTNDRPSVTWFISPRHDQIEEGKVPAAISPSLGAFRSVLARFNAGYLKGNLYGDFAMRFLRQDDRVHRCLMYTSNTGLSGFWIRVYSQRVDASQWTA